MERCRSRPTRRYAGRSFGRAGALSGLSASASGRSILVVQISALFLDKETSGVQAVRSSLWREGAVHIGVAFFPHWPVLAGIEAAYIARWAARRLREDVFGDGGCRQNDYSASTSSE